MINKNTVGKQGARRTQSPKGRQLTLGGKRPSMETIEQVLARASEAAEDDGTVLEAAIRDSGDVLLDAARAERLYTRVLEELQGLKRADMASSARKAAEERIRGEVAVLVAGVKRPPPLSAVAGNQEGVKLIERNGMKPHAVEPIPTFYGVPVTMWEGYVDVTTLDPWAENHRVLLFVEEFIEKNGRKPEPDELLKILTGQISLGDEDDNDPFELKPLAESIARKGVERPPILTFEGVPCDGNRRIAASRLVLQNKRATDQEKERARWIRVWRAPFGTTKDQLHAIVVAMNFEDDHKQLWPEYVKARIVVDEFRSRREAEGRPASPSRTKAIKDEVARKYAIKTSEVTRYLEMVQWADDFLDYQTERGIPRAQVQHRTDNIFQWFYELGAGPTGEKVTEQFASDPALKAMVYDMMFDGTFDSGAQVRQLHAVVSDEEGVRQLERAHQIREKDKKEARALVEDAVLAARARVRARKAIGLDQYLYAITERLEKTPPSAWTNYPTDFLEKLRATLHRTVGALDGELVARSKPKARKAS